MSKPIYVLCLHNVRTGGPEAIHQLSDALIEQGFDARMVYYTWPEIAQLEQASPQIGYRFGNHVNGIEEYFRYKTNVTDHVPNSPDCVVVLPETLCHLAPKFDKATVLIWWLSVDNGFGALSRVNLNHLRKPNVKHVAQSFYARKVIEALGLLEHGYPNLLGDYTVDLTAYATPLPMEERGKVIAYNANHKITADLPLIIHMISTLNPEVECVPAQGSRAEIASLFARARVYLDLGTFPGKDRMPREAAHMGCSVLLSRSGASADYERRTSYVVSAGSPFFYAGANYSSEAAQYAEALVRRPQPSSWDIVAERQQFFADVKHVFHDL